MKIVFCLLVLAISNLASAKPLTVIRGDVELKADVVEFPVGNFNLRDPHAIVEGKKHYLSVVSVGTHSQYLICRYYGFPKGVHIDYSEYQGAVTPVIHFSHREITFQNYGHFIRLEQLTCAK